jgi:hypothetical protein
MEPITIWLRCKVLSNKYLFNKNRILIILSIVIFLLFIPLIAMQFTNQVNWTIFDFFTMGLLLFAIVFTCEFINRKIINSRYKLLFLTIVLILFLLMWIELSVGIFGTPFAGN